MPSGIEGGSTFCTVSEQIRARGDKSRLGKLIANAHMSAGAQAKYIMNNKHNTERRLPVWRSGDVAFKWGSRRHRHKRVGSSFN